MVSGIVNKLVARTGARPLMLAGAALMAGGMYWFSHVSAHALPEEPVMSASV